MTATTRAAQPPPPLHEQHPRTSRTHGTRHPSGRERRRDPAGVGPPSPHPVRGGAARSSPLSLPRKQPSERGWGGAGLALMTSRVRLNGCESSSAKPLLGSFQERSFNSLLFPGHCTDLNVNTLSRIQAPPASSEARNDAGSRPDPHSTGTGP